MKNLIKFELYKLVRSKSFYICLGITLALSLLNIGLIFAESAFAKAFSEEIGEALDTLSETISANDLMLSALSSNAFTTLIGIFAAIFLCEDYTLKTVKNVYARGFSRTRVYFSKLLAVLIGTTVAVIITLLFNFALGMIFLGRVGDFYNFFLYVDQYLTVLVFVSLVVLTVFLTKKISLAILALLFAPMLGGLLLGLVDLLIRSDTFAIADYWFSTFMASVSQPASTQRLLTVGIGSIVYTAAFVCIGWLVNEKHDL